MGELSPQQRIDEIKDEFKLESVAFKVAPEGSNRRQVTATYIDHLLDEYLDMWPELVER